MLESLVSFAGGVGFGLAAGSPVEWTIHKYLLHAKKRNFITSKPARAHTDEHHAGYKGPEHYYKDMTNEHVVSHFSAGDVGLIGGIAALTGIGINRAYDALTGSVSKGMEIKDWAFVGGVVAGTLGYYACYESIHALMHHQGERRFTITNMLGDKVQGERADGKLRLSKPLLDDICDRIEKDVEIYRNSDWEDLTFSYNPSLINRLEDQIDGQRERAHIYISRGDSEELLNEVTRGIAEMEDEKELEYGSMKKSLISIKKNIGRKLRSLPFFASLDNHHFLHHDKYGKNLNVVLPAMDCVMGTKVDSSRDMLEKNKRLWLCPNSPDIVPFFLVK